MNAIKKSKPPVVDPAKQPSWTEKLKRQAIEDAGYPKNVLRVDIRPISKTQARVNVWVKEGDFCISGKIVYSAIYGI